MSDAIGVPVPGGVSEGSGGSFLGDLVRWGLRAEQGRRPTMEDSHVVREIKFRDSRPEWHGAIRDGALICVFDGHGGKEASECAASCFADKLLGCPSLAGGDVEAALQAAFMETDREVLAQAQGSRTSIKSLSQGSAAANKEEKSFSGNDTEALTANFKSGSTAVVVLVLTDDPQRAPGKEDAPPSSQSTTSGSPRRKPSMASTARERSPLATPVLWVANVGDSEAVLGNRYDVSTRHKPREDDIFIASVASHAHKPTDDDERERIEAAGGKVVRGRVFGMLAVARSLGDIDYKFPFNNGSGDYVSAEPYVAKIPLAPVHEFCIVSCDGLWERLSYDTAVRAVYENRLRGLSAREAARELVRLGIENGSRDNVSAVVLFFSPELALPTTREKTRKDGRSRSIRSPNTRSNNVGESEAAGDLVVANPLFQGTKHAGFASTSLSTPSSPRLQKTQESSKIKESSKTSSPGGTLRRGRIKFSALLGISVSQPETLPRGRVNSKGDHEFEMANPLHGQTLRERGAKLLSPKRGNATTLSAVSGRNRSSSMASFRSDSSDSSASGSGEKPTALPRKPASWQVLQKQSVDHTAQELTSTRRKELDKLIQSLSSESNLLHPNVRSLVRFQANVRRRQAQRTLRERQMLERARRATLKVIIATVKEYLEKLNLLVDVYLNPLKQHLAMTAAAGGHKSNSKDKAIIDPAALTYVFPTPTLEVIIDKSSRLLESLVEVLNEGTRPRRKALSLGASRNGPKSSSNDRDQKNKQTDKRLPLVRNYGATNGNDGNLVSPLSSPMSPRWVDTEKSNVHGLIDVEGVIEEAPWTANDVSVGEISERVIVTPSVGKIFEDFSQYVSEYRRYISDYLTLSVPTLASLRKSNPKFAAWEELVRTDAPSAVRSLSVDDNVVAATGSQPSDLARISAASLSGWLDLSALLRRPVDHLPMMTQLVQQLCIKTWDEHVDFAALNASLRELATVERFIADVRTLRSATRRLAGSKLDRLNLDEPGHRFLREGDLMVEIDYSRKQYVDVFSDSRSKGHHRRRRSVTSSEGGEGFHVFLFDDQLVLTHVMDDPRPRGEPQECHVRIRICLDGVANVAMVSSETSEFALIDSAGMVVARARPVDEQTAPKAAAAWLKAIREGAAQHRKAVALRPARRDELAARKTRQMEARRRSKNHTDWRNATDAVAAELGVSPNISALQGSSLSRIAASRSQSHSDLSSSADRSGNADSVTVSPTASDDLVLTVSKRTLHVTVRIGAATIKLSCRAEDRVQAVAARIAERVGAQMEDVTLELDGKGVDGLLRLNELELEHQKVDFVVRSVKAPPARSRSPSPSLTPPTES